MSRDNPLRLILTYLGFIAVIAAILLLTTRARAHEWYPIECCSDRDCWIAGDGGAEPEPRATPSGWVLHDGTLVPYHEARPSPDGRFHVCRHGGSVQGAVIRAGRVCLWAPQGAS
ncbi:MAG: hypothetical protein LCH61_20430 [Proteobacteria bacterium]|nr:hypothetical protein [Pseudomonadota bacterium]